MNYTWDQLQQQFLTWHKEFQEQQSIQLKDFPGELPYNAMTLSTVTQDHRPSSRVMLLKEVNKLGFVFFTNYQSQKGQDLDHNPYAALNFYWPLIVKQVRVLGKVEKTTRQDSIDYWASRPYLSQISGTISPQGKKVPSFQWTKEQAEKLKSERPTPPLPCPDFWGGYILIPTEIEFWKGDRYRLHERELFQKDEHNNWIKNTLAP